MKYFFITLFSNLSSIILLGQILPTEQTKPEIYEGHIVYWHADTMPLFKGGEIALNKFIQKNIPDSLRKAGYKVNLVIIIDDQGNVKNPQCIISTGDSYRIEPYKTEALRIIQKMPKWIPGSYKGNNVYVKRPLIIDFRPLPR